MADDRGLSYEGHHTPAADVLQVYITSCTDAAPLCQLMIASTVCLCSLQFLSVFCDLPALFLSGWMSDGLGQRDGG